MRSALRLSVDGGGADAPRESGRATGSRSAATDGGGAPTSRPVSDPGSPTGLLIGVSPAIDAVRASIARLARSMAPVAITGDLAAFWRGAWADARKDMRGRYPRHDWPEDPAAITSGQVS